MYVCVYVIQYLSINSFECLLHALPPSPKAVQLLISFESGTLVLVETSTAFTGQRSLIFCKVASAAGGHSLSAVSDSCISALIVSQVTHMVYSCSVPKRLYACTRAACQYHSMYSRTSLIWTS